MSTSNSIHSVAVVGAGGNLGSFITATLLETGKFDITAITRQNSTSVIPTGVKIARVDYDDPKTLVAALQGQDALVVAISGASSSGQDVIIHAAVAAGVPWILPNEWASDTANEELVQDIPPLQMKVDARKLLDDLGGSAYIAIATGYWYEWSLGKPEAFGFDLKNKTVTMFDDGETKVSISTWPQIGRAVASLLSLPVDAGGSPCLNQYRNKVVYINSFTISQRDMLASVLRVTDTNESDWTIKKEPSHERRAAGLRELQDGKVSGFSKAFLTRVFYPDGGGDFEMHKGTLNAVLGLPEIDIDTATQVGLERQGGLSVVR